jgi:hypothetical protein
LSFTQTYKKLFEVCIYHHYFLNKGTEVFDKLNDADKKLVLKSYDVQTFLSIAPTAACAAALRKNRLICKPTPTGFIVGVLVKAAGNNFEPVVPLDEQLKFAFRVSFDDPYFFNYTSLPLERPSGKLYYFNNRKDGTKKQATYLSQVAPQFTAGQRYSAGDILSDSEANPIQTFIAARVQKTAPPGAGWISDEKVNNKPLHYATGNDLLPVYSDLLRFDTGKKNLNLTVAITNRLGIIINPEFETIAEADNTVLLADIHHLPEDFYTIQLTDAASLFDKTFSFYRLQKSFGADALLELSVKSDAADYQMIGAGGVLRSPVYELRFRNRSLVWQYNGKQFTKLPRTDPNPLTRYGFIAVTLKNDADKDVDLPNPDVRIIKVEQPAAANPQYNLFTETFVH